MTFFSAAVPSFTARDVTAKLAQNSMASSSVFLVLIICRRRSEMACA